jgi:Rad3-related DNA helicase
MITFRPGQEDVVNEIVEYFQSGGTKCILDAPTGTGKSFIAVAIAERMSLSTTIITNTIELSHQYQKDFSIPVLKGREHYPCDFEPEDLQTHRSLHWGGYQCEKIKCDLIEDCKYYNAKQAFINHPIRVTNYNYWLCDRSIKQNLAIFDEAHEFDSKIVDTTHLNINSKRLNLLLNRLDIHPDINLDIFTPRYEDDEDCKERLYKHAREAAIEYSEITKSL